MNWQIFLHEAYHHFVIALPWLTGGACVAMISCGPIGRAIGRKLTQGSPNAHQTTALMNEVADLRADVIDLMDRLDEQHRDLERPRRPNQAPRLREWMVSEERIETPV